MRHIALLSVLCISVSTIALTSSLQAAPAQGLKERLAAARVEAQGNAPAALVAPPVSLAKPDVAPVAKAATKPQEAKDIVQPPLLAIDAVPQPGANVPLASSPVMKAADDVSSLPAFPPVAAQVKSVQVKAVQDKKAVAPVVAPVIVPAQPVKTVTAPKQPTEKIIADKVATPVQINEFANTVPQQNIASKTKSVETIKNDIMNAKAVPIIQEKSVAPQAATNNSITWHENKPVQTIAKTVDAPPVAKPVTTAVAPVVTPAPVAVTQSTAAKMTSEAVIPNEKLAPVSLPNAFVPLASTVKEPQKAKAPVDTTVVAKPVAEETPAVVETVAVAKEEPTVKTAATEPVKETVKETPQEKVASESVKKEIKETAQTDLKQDIKPAKPELLPMPSKVATAEPKRVDATKNVSITQAAPQQVPAVPVIPASTKSTVAHVPATTPVGAWSTRMVGSATDKDNAFCMLENKFSNQTALMIGQRADGYGTIGINYGVDMLDTGRHYSTLVMVDDGFEESFNGYAESGRMMIVQLGKKPSFFAMLTNAQNLRVMLQGVASNFATQGIGPALNEFSTCLASIGGSLPSAAPATVLAQGQNMPAVPTGSVASDDLTPPPIAAPSTTSAINTADAAPVANTPAKAVTVVNGWGDYIRNVLNNAGIRPKNIQQNSGVTEWTDANGMHGQVWQVPGADILEASMTQLDTAEQECSGEFTNQIGTPETVHGQTVQMMESKCASASGVSVSTWLIQQNPSGITAWEMRAPQAQNVASFDTRQKILNAINSQPNS